MESYCGKWPCFTVKWFESFYVVFSSITRLKWQCFKTGNDVIAVIADGGPWRHTTSCGTYFIPRLLVHMASSWSLDLTSVKKCNMWVVNRLIPSQRTIYHLQIIIKSLSLYLWIEISKAVECSSFCNTWRTWICFIRKKNALFDIN